MEYYKKEVFTAGPDSVEHVKDFVRNNFPGDMSFCDREVLVRSCQEVMENIAWADHAGGSVTVTLDPTDNGFGIQFLHLGPIFNPCPSSEKGFARTNMDEMSYEFKYGRNALTLFRKKHTDPSADSDDRENPGNQTENTQKNMLINTKVEENTMANITVRNYTLKAGDKIISVRDFSKESLLAKMKELAADPAVNAVEWRIDEYENVFEVTFKIMPETVAAVREALGDKILMYTFRDRRIGGAHPTNCMYATRLNNLALHPGAGDLVTVEWVNEIDQAVANITNIHEAGKLAVASWCTEDSFCRKCVEKKLTEMLDSKCDVFEFGALCRDDEAKAELKAGAEAFKTAHPEIPVIISAKDAAGNEEKTVL